jgi:hypothetical protein
VLGVAVDIPDQQATGTLGSIFGTILLLLEVAMAFGASLIKSYAGPQGTRIVYAVLAFFGVVSVAGVRCILPLSVGSVDPSRGLPRGSTSFGNNRSFRYTRGCTVV